MYPGRLGARVKFLLRYGEMGLKGRHVRGQMMRRLRENVLRLLGDKDGGGRVSEEEGRLFVESDDPDTTRRLGRVFGLVSFSPVWESSGDLESIPPKAVWLAKEVRTGGPSFAVRTRRVGEHPFTSADVARQVGSAILARFPELTVNLTAPDWEVHVEVRGAKAFLFTEIVPGVGGLPLGTQGKVVSLVESPEGAMASWLMMKRGCYVLPVFRGEDKWAAALQAWDPGLRWHEIDSPEEMRQVADDAGALGFVYPWTATEMPKGNFRPAFYPLMGFNSARLEGLPLTVLGPT